MGKRNKRLRKVLQEIVDEVVYFGNEEDKACWPGTLAHIKNIAATALKETKRIKRKP